MNFRAGRVRHDRGVVRSRTAQPENAADGGDDARPEDGVTLLVDDGTREVARREAVVEAGDAAAVGQLVDAVADGDDVVTVRFSAELEGYRGWRWSVTLSVLDPARPTVSEVVLLPGPDALLAPAWVPWEERVRSGDLGVGDLMPPAPDDERIVPAYLQSDDPAVEELAREVGLGRVRVLSRVGRAEAAERWHTGTFGPDDEMARHAPGTCATCAFFVPLAGALGAGFGVCANDISPADGRVVDVAYGCGAHSEATVHRPAASATGDNVLDELRLDVFVRDADEAAVLDDAVVVDVAEVDTAVADELDAAASGTSIAVAKAGVADDLEADVTGDAEGDDVASVADDVASGTGDHDAASGTDDVASGTGDDDVASVADDDHDVASGTDDAAPADDAGTDTVADD